MFTKRITTRGDLMANFVFETQAQVDDWIRDEFPKLEIKYDGLTYDVSDLPGLKVGDQCNVYGEADDVFTIVDLVKWDEHRYGFVLDIGCVEEVAKCHVDHLR